MLSRLLFFSAIAAAIASLTVGNHRAAAEEPATTPSTSPTSPPVPAPTTGLSAAEAAEIERLVSGLSADDWKVRKNSREELITFGDDVVPRVERLLNESQDPDVLAAAKAILEAVATNREIGPSLITLDVTDAEPKDVFEAIAKQAKAELRPWPDEMWERGRGRGGFLGFGGPKKITLSVKRQPFWAVMKDLLPRAGMRLQQMGGPDAAMRVMLGDDQQMAGPSIVDGPFLIVATGAHESKSIQYGRGNNNANSSLSVNLTIYAEPKLRVIARSYQATVEEAVDDAGHPLTVGANPVRGGGRGMSGGGSQNQFSVQVPLTRVEGMTKKIATLSGSVSMVLQTRSETLEIADLMNVKGATHTAAGRQIIINEAVALDGNQYKLKVSLSRVGPVQSGVMNEWEHIGNDANRIQILDAAGKPMGSRSSSWRGGENQRYDGEFTIHSRDGAGPPARLVAEFPVEYKDVTVPFEFKDLPLP